MALNLAPFWRMRCTNLLPSMSRKKRSVTTSGVNKNHVFKFYSRKFPKFAMNDQQPKAEESRERVIEHEFAKPDMQEARAFLRERFLRVVTGIVGKRAEFHLHENSKVSGEFRGCDVDGLEVYVRNLETPLGKVPEAILRSTDIIHFKVDEVNVQR